MVTVSRTVTVEVKVTPWVNVEDRPEWRGSGIAAYRIWQEYDGRHWWQCHEWEKATGNRERYVDGWIPGIRGWFSTAVDPLSDEEIPA